MVCVLDSLFIPMGCKMHCIMEKVGTTTNCMVLRYYATAMVVPLTIYWHPHANHKSNAFTYAIRNTHKVSLYCVLVQIAPWL